MVPSATLAALAISEMVVSEDIFWEKISSAARSILSFLLLIAPISIRVFSESFCLIVEMTAPAISSKSSSGSNGLLSMIRERS